MPGPRPRRLRVRPGVHLDRPAPGLPGTPTVTCSWTAPWPGSTSGASSVSSSIRPQPARSPARTASSTNAVPGTSTVPATAWSASHGCVPHRQPAGEHKPPARRQLHRRAQQRMTRRAQPRGRDIARAAADGRGQNRCRWNAYVGRSTRRPPPSTAAQSTRCRARSTSASDARNRPGPPSSRRSVPVTTGAVRRPCVLQGLGDRRGQHRVRGHLDEHPVPGGGQHPHRPVELHRRPQAVIPVPGPGLRPSSDSPVIAETIGTRAGPGVIPASTARISSRISSTCALCEA